MFSIYRVWGLLGVRCSEIRKGFAMQGTNGWAKWRSIFVTLGALGGYGVWYRGTTLVSGSDGYVEKLFTGWFWVSGARKDLRRFKICEAIIRSRSTCSYSYRWYFYSAEPDITKYSKVFRRLAARGNSIIPRKTP